mmetsp:Transcript_84574/g.176930  ORF Transcript_84574/g.176930 Transcript_84574/m.176930 type:complete len:257 (+) Transcript_84574:84-854(+)|eukprot:CAMPEP_0206447140 /NCGR_PEP_ID=MMETSP0324_2-20121206/16595_1 /ASSEMBLY_ACC=CAM_ASM_000836 /TAXON_ID=2866 /ORGANISM="Crypthecodinium cohnii, Strain Seligo" /LENGTH=256 /DNA_ID=CAMNT_0053915827 /DNA_START=81 /DNA_END=851 /DNA_ORIENTATION=+
MASDADCVTTNGCKLCYTPQGPSCSGTCSWQTACPLDQRVDTIISGNDVHIIDNPGSNDTHIINSNSTAVEAAWAERSGPADVIGSAIHLVILLIFAWVFKKKVMSKLPKVNTYDRERRERKVGLFACCSNLDVCLHTTCCLPVVAGKVSEQSGVIGYWGGCVMATIVTMPFLLGVEFLRCFWRVYTVHQYKENMGYEPDLCNSCMLGLCCYACEIGRETMEVDAEVGKAPACCCKVKTVESMADSSSYDYDSSSE